MVVSCLRPLFDVIHWAFKDITRRNSRRCFALVLVRPCQKGGSLRNGPRSGRDGTPILFVDRPPRSRPRRPAPPPSPAIRATQEPGWPPSQGVNEAVSSVPEAGPGVFELSRTIHECDSIHTNPRRGETHMRRPIGTRRAPSSE